MAIDFSRKAMDERTFPTKYIREPMRLQYFKVTDPYGKTYAPKHGLLWGAIANARAASVGDEGVTTLCVWRVMKWTPNVQDHEITPVGTLVFDGDGTCDYVTHDENWCFAC